MAEGRSPWHFLLPLDQENAADQQLIHQTRQLELRIVVNMIISSRVSILYAFSGNGKTSLINAGIIPFFTDQGYVVLKTRPRPP